AVIVVFAVVVVVLAAVIEILALVRVVRRVTDLIVLVLEVVHRLAVVADLGVRRHVHRAVGLGSLTCAVAAGMAGASVAGRGLGLRGQRADRQDEGRGQSGRDRDANVATHKNPRELKRLNNVRFSPAGCPALMLSGESWGMLQRKRDGCELLR